jgi:hypothetical protein
VTDSDEHHLLSIDAVDAWILVEASHDAMLRLLQEIEREVHESMALDLRAATDLANWAEELAAITRISRQLIEEGVRRQLPGLKRPQSA